MAAGRYRKAIISGILLIAAIFTVYGGRGMLTENPFETVRTFNGPSHAVSSADGSLLVTDGGKTRVTVLSENKISATITGTKDSGGFFYAERMAVVGGKVYIADVKYAEGNTAVESERILRFTARGRFEKVLFERTYDDDKPLQYGNILDMRASDGDLFFIMRSGETLELYSLADEAPSLLCVISTETAPHIRCAVYDVFTDKVYAVSKTGLIYAENTAGGPLAPMQSGLEVISDMSETGGIPWDVAADSGGNVYFTNLSERAVTNLSGNTVFKGGGVVYRLDINNDDIITFTDNESVYQLGADGSVLYAENAATYTKAYFALRLVVWLSAVFAGFMLLYVIVRLAVWAMRRERGEQTKYLLVIAASMLLTSGIVAVSLIGNSLESSADMNAYTLTQITLSVSQLSHLTIGDDLEALGKLSDYGGEAFNRLRGALDPICGAAREQGEYLYFALYKVIGGTLCGVMDYEDTVGVIYPLGDCPEEYLALLSGDLPCLFERGSDAYGSWSYAVAPVYNSRGETVGLIEFGSNLDVESLRTRRQIQEAVLSTAVLPVLFLLVFSEAGALAEAFSVSAKAAGRDGHIPEFIRPLTFLAFLADNTCAAFIPQLSGRLFLSSEIGLTLSVGAALPLSAHLLFIAIAAITGGALIDRFGMKLMLAVGIVVEMVGLSLTAAAVTADGYALLLTGMSVSGCGLGMVLVSGNTLSAGFEDENRRNALFSGVNIGLVSGSVVGTSLGAYLAQTVGYAQTFFFSAVVLLPALWFGMKCAPQLHGRADRRVSKRRAADGRPRSFRLYHTVRFDATKEKETSVTRFLFNRSVFSFLLFAMFPFLTILYFKDFVFPLFAEEQGFSDVAIGQTLLFSGAAAILIAPAASKALLERLGAKGVNIFSGALFAVSLLLFALFPTIGTSVITVCILSVAGCVGLVAQSVYFSAIRAFRDFGAGRSMGVYSLFDNLSQTAGPLLFGAALVLGYRTAGLLMGLSAAAMLVLFALIGENDREKKENDIG